jgi:hypothetical protein
MTPFPIPIIYIIGFIMLGQVGVCIWMALLLRQQRKLINPFWKVFQDALTKSLHHPHPESHEMDKLLEQLENLTIDQWGTERLRVLLHEKTLDESQSEEERGRAKFLLFAMPLVVKEREAAEERD